MTRPRVTFSTTSPAQHDELVAYAKVKGFKDLSAFALYACVTMMAKNPLTGAQAVKAKEITEERRARPLALAQRGKEAV